MILFDSAKLILYTCKHRWHGRFHAELYLFSGEIVYKGEHVLRKIVIAAISMIMTISAAAYADSADYYPLADGNQWLYEIYSETSEGSETTHGWITASPASGSEGVFVLQASNAESGERESTTWMRKDSDGSLYQFANGYDGEQLIDFEPPFLMLPGELTVGYEWDNKIEIIKKNDPDNPDSSHVRYRIEDMDATVTVIAGTFEHCLKLSEKTIDSDGTVVEVCEVFCAENVGNILYQLVSEDDVVFRQELVEFHAGPTAVETEQPLAFSLSPNFPNPFNPATTIPFTLDHDAAISLSVYNMVGEKVATLAEGQFQAGTHSVEWNASAHASGVYFYRLNVDGATLSGKMTLVK